MINKIKNNFGFIFACAIVFIMISTGIYKYYTHLLKEEQWDKEVYEQCQTGELSGIACTNNPIKRRDTLNTYGYILSVYIGDLMIDSLIVMIAAAWIFHRKLRKGMFKNMLTRMGYKTIMKKLYLSSLKSTLIFPFFLLFLFIVSYLISGNFDYEYGVNVYWFNSFGLKSIDNVPLFLIAYICNMILYEMFWVNIVVYNCRFNKSLLLTIIISYIEYFVLGITGNIIVLKFLNGFEYADYFLLGSVWIQSGLNVYQLLPRSILFAVLSGLIVYLAYRKKEDLVIEIEK